jgi:hypothetical protein
MPNIMKCAVQCRARFKQSQVSHGLGSHIEEVSKYTGDNYEDMLQLTFLWFK